ncbi:hypothetical protein MTO96_028334 [Rhipicephalus appendiculatus]
MPGAFEQVFSAVLLRRADLGELQAPSRETDQPCAACLTILDADRLCPLVFQGEEENMPSLLIPFCQSK